MCWLGSRGEGKERRGAEGIWLVEEIGNTGKITLSLSDAAYMIS